MSQKDDNGWMAVEYNRLPVGGVLKVGRPSNTTLFKRYTLETRGLKDKEDFVADSRGNHCIIRRLTLTPMR